jgi:hypothetical protein
MLTFTDMKRLLLLFPLIPILACSQVRSALFIGNSYTATNNLPYLVSELALSGGDTLFYDAYTPGGYTFQMHSQDTNAINRINARPWDYVFLQGQSQEPSLDTPYVINNVFPFAAMLNNLVLQNDSCTQVVYFMTWGRKNGDASNCGFYPPVCTYSGMQDQLRGRYLQMANDNGAIVAPAGAAWQNAVAAGIPFDLWISDESHPSLHGSYLTACVFYATIYRRSPVGLSYTAGLSLADAQALQQFAELTVMDSLEHWRTESYYPYTDFSVSGSGLSVTLQADSINYGGYRWSDGVTPGFVNGGPTMNFVYATSGNYQVCLLVDNGCLSDTTCHIVPVGTLGINENRVEPFEIVYDPGERKIHYAGKNAAVLVLYDAAGREIMRTGVSENSEIDLSEFTPGVYLCVLENQTGTFTRKILR